MSALILAASLSIGAQARMLRAQGKVAVSLPGEAYRSAKTGETLEEGSRVRTGAQSEAALQMNDGTTFKLHERGEMQVTAIKRAEMAPKTAVVLFFGRLWAIVRKSSRNNFDVVTPSTVAGARGTEFTTAAGEDGATRVEVNEGTVVVDNDNDNASVGPGQQTDSSADGVGAPKRKTDTDWKQWSDDKRANLAQGGEALAKAQKKKIEERRAEIERLWKRQAALKEEHKKASERGRTDIKRELRVNAARLSELGAKATGQFGLFEHWGELAVDPDFSAKFMGAGFVHNEIERMRAVRADLEKMIAEGTDKSMKGLDKMIDDMKDGKTTIKDKKGSSKDLFGE